MLVAARRAGVGIQSVCGGTGSCSLCVVELEPETGLIAPAEEREDLDSVGAGPNARLACRVLVDRDLNVSVPVRSFMASQRLHLEAFESAVEVEPAVTVRVVSLPEPDGQGEGNGVAAVRRGICMALADPNIEVPPGVVAGIGALPAGNGDQVRVVLKGRSVVSVARPGSALLGLAVDVGTTKLAGYLVDLETGKTLAAAGLMNPQIAFGEDVMARIAYAMRSPQDARELRRVVVDRINHLVRKMCRTVRVSSRDIVDVVAVGNTAMHHILLGLPVEQLGRAPYLAVETDALDVNASDIGLEVEPGVWLHALPNVAGFVGADHVAFLLATLDIHADGVVLGLDVGTNTEITLRTPDGMLCCSCASGPVFEGAHIRDGMRASKGAIERLRIEESGQVEYQTVGGGAPVGLCGSGVLDVVAQLRARGIISASGAFRDHAGVAQGSRGKAFLIAPRQVTAHGEQVLFTAEDVGQVQLAKAAIRAGTEILLEDAGLKDSDIGHVVLAGTFGTYLDPASAVSIGMFPDLPMSRFQQVGNAAGAGARAALVSVRARERAAEIAEADTYVELMTHSRFADIFTESLLLG